MEELSEILKNNRTDDVTWFCSLSESELDLLTSFKKLAIQRAKITGQEELAENFDLKMLRALGLVLMEYARKRVKDDKFLAPSAVHQLRLLDNCNLLKTYVDDSIDIDEVLTDVCKNNSKKKRLKRLEAVETSFCNGEFDCLKRAEEENGMLISRSYKKMDLARIANRVEASSGFFVPYSL